jgi:hypothetical protein
LRFLSKFISAILPRITRIFTKLLVKIRVIRGKIKKRLYICSTQAYNRLEKMTLLHLQDLVKF